MQCLSHKGQGTVSGFSFKIYFHPNSETLHATIELFYGVTEFVDMATAICL